ncbi:hypothetical protein [Clostridium estertheticum]|uniref:hypothetical protein n=1 Tax=Clostridium estertheticum TaxID=238834 RepID=UPI00124CE499|nr:hypothetical protein [Clostridium estertheticum]MBZ9618333.1 hypothetical protein [Clostridium estertheticum subsp. laramiense]WAG76169.1 hypothetical protein LL032_23575 [Clostridium estertheticum]
MSYLILGFSLLVIFLMISSKNIFYKYSDRINLKIKKRLDTMLKFTKIAPILVLFIILTLTLTYFKTKYAIRLSHAWLVLSFWMCTIIFYYIIAEIAIIKKVVIIIPTIGLIISMCNAIYLTPLLHYENIFQNINIMIPNFFGLIMLIIAYYITYLFLKKGIKK